MGKYLKKFDTHTEYQTYINGSDKVLPNVSYCEDNDSIHFNPWIETRLIVKYLVDNASEPTLLYGYNREEGNEDYWVIGNDLFDKIEIDNVEVSISDLDTAEGKYQLLAREHIVKYTLKDPTSIPLSVFCDCTGITSIEIPNSVTSIGYMAFYGCTGITNITIPNSVTSIDYYAFANCTGLTSIEIPDSVTSIGTYAFDSCSSLTSITIPSGVTSIGNFAFNACTGLTSITSLATTAPNIGGNSTFKNIKSGGTLYVPTGSTGYDTWMGTGNYYLGKYNWTKVEQ